MTRSRLRVAAWALVIASAGAKAQTAAPSTAPAAAAHAPFPAGENSPLGSAVAALLRDPAVSRAHWGIAVMTMEGTPLFGLNEGQYFRPASNAKLFTTAAAMALLGPDATVITTVETNGAIDAQGVLHGDVILRGAGDANLSGRPLPYSAPVPGKAEAETDPLRGVDELAAQIAARGIRRIDGQVVGDDTLWPHDPYGTGWNIDDMVWGYGAPVSALAVTDNQIEMVVAPGAKAGAPATVTLSPEVLWIGPADRVTHVTTLPPKSAGEVMVDREALEKGELQVSGQVAVGAPDTENVAVLDPAQFAAQALKQRLAAHGISAGETVGKTSATPAPTFTWSEARKPLGLGAPHPPANPCAAGCQVLASRVSVPLAEDVALTLKVSQNLHAEMLLRRLGAAYGGSGSFVEGVRVVRQWLVNAGLDDDDFAFFDGSGLSDKDVVTPRATAQLLAYAGTQPWFAAWKAGLPVGGVDGSLVGRFREPPLKGKVFAKTGTLGETRALSGYLEAASGRTVIFSILVDTHQPGSSADREAMDRIVAAIAAAE